MAAITHAVVVAGIAFGLADARVAGGQRLATPQPSSAQPSSAIEQQVIAASNEWDDALYRNDLEALARILTDDFLTIQIARNGVAVVEKPAQLEVLRRGGDTRPRQRRKLDRVRVRVHGDTAILTAVAIYGEAPATRSVISEVWARTDGKWRLMHFQPTPAVRPNTR